MKAETLLREAADLVGGDRARTHGDKRENHENIGAYWSVYLTIELGIAGLQGRGQHLRGG